MTSENLKNQRSPDPDEMLAAFEANAKITGAWGKVNRIMADHIELPSDIPMWLDEYEADFSRLPEEIRNGYVKTFDRIKNARNFYKKGLIRRLRLMIFLISEDAKLATQEFNFLKLVNSREHRREIGKRRWQEMPKAADKKLEMQEAINDKYEKNKNLSHTKLCELVAHVFDYSGRTIKKLTTDPKKLESS